MVKVENCICRAQRNFTYGNGESGLEGVGSDAAVASGAGTDSTSGADTVSVSALRGAEFKSTSAGGTESTSGGTSVVCTVLSVIVALASAGAGREVLIVMDGRKAFPIC